MKEEELNKTRNLFINAMAHEMKTPNAVILNKFRNVDRRMLILKNKHK